VAKQEILKRCRELLPTPMVPRRLIELDEMPTNTSGKVDRKALRAMLEAPAPATQPTGA